MAAATTAPEIQTNVTQERGDAKNAAARTEKTRDRDKSRETTGVGVGGGGVGGGGYRRENIVNFLGMEEDKPSKVEIWVWYLYGMCCYFVITTLVPVVFPLIISQVLKHTPPQPVQGWNKTHKGFVCHTSQMQLYERLKHRSISINTLHLSALDWTSISWVLGLILTTPLIGFISTHLDHGQSQQLIAIAATVAGAVFCLPVGFFKTVWIFPVYIAVIVLAYTIANASHTRHMALMVRGHVGSTLRKGQFNVRRSVSSRFSLYAASAGFFGAAVISAFTYHMLRQPEKSRFISLWIVSIFSGLIWLVGIFHAVTTRSPLETHGTFSPDAQIYNFLPFLKYPYAIGSLFVVFLSSFSSMCIFTGGVLFLLGQVCLKPVYILFAWLIYFIFPTFALPLLQPLQSAIKADAVKMNALGFLLSVFSAGMGFYFRNRSWDKGHVWVFAAIQGMSAGILHAFGRVLMLDCSPPGREGGFSMWYSWTRGFGTWVGFVVASSVGGDIISASFGVAFWVGVIGIIALVFGNISDVGGAVAAGNLVEQGERGSSVTMKEAMHEDKV